MHVAHAERMDMSTFCWTALIICCSARCHVEGSFKLVSLSLLLGQIGLCPLLTVSYLYLKGDALICGLGRQDAMNGFNVHGV